MKKIKRYLQQQGWYLESKSLYDGKATLLGGNLLEGKMNLKKQLSFLLCALPSSRATSFWKRVPETNCRKMKSTTISRMYICCLLYTSDAADEL